MSRFAEPQSAESDVLNRIDQHCTSRGCAGALIDVCGASLTYAGLGAAVSSGCEGMRACGVVSGQTVALAMRGGWETVCALLAGMKIGACAPLNPELVFDEARFQLEALRPAALVVDEGEECAAVRAAEVLGIPLLAAAGVTAPGPPRLAFRGVRPGAAANAPGSAERAVLLLHTSATTGSPKLVPITAGNLSAMLKSTLHALELTEADRFLSMMPLFHLQGLVSALAQLAAGGSMICAGRFDSERFADWMSELRPTWYTAGPALHRAILDVLRSVPETARIPGLRFIRSIGAALPLDLLRTLEDSLGVPVIEGYGLTETGTVTSTPFPPAVRKPGSAGISAGPEIAIMDPAGALLPHGTEGEIVVRGPGVMHGYRGACDANRMAFHDGWLRTGDLGRLNPDGHLYVTGRIKEIINRGGEKVIPAEVDAVLLSHPSVADAAAFRTPHPTLGEDVAAALVLKPGASLDRTGLRRFASERMAAFKVPRLIFFVDSIPKSATGKPKRVELPEKVRALPVSGEPRTAPRNTAESAIARIWSEILEVESFGMEDDFFAIGGDSLRAARMLARVQAELGASPRLLDRADFFDSPTVAALAAIVAECWGGGPAGIRTAAPGADSAEPFTGGMVQLQPGGPDGAVFFIPGAGMDPYYFRHVANALGPDRAVYAVREFGDPTHSAFCVESLAERVAGLISRAQPRGACVLAGHCFGGAVAFETARLFARSGRRVALVVLFDAPTPGYPRFEGAWRRYLRYMRRILRGEGRVEWNEISEHVGWLRERRKGPAQRVRTTVLLPALAGRNSRPPMTAGDAVAAAMSRYRPGRLDVPVVHFLAADERASTRVYEDARLGWRDFSPMETRTAPGNHDTMFLEANARAIAAALKPLLDTAASGRLPHC